MRRVIEEVGIIGVKLAYDSGDFFHSAQESFEDLSINVYADDLVAMCDNAADLESFVRAFEKVTQELSLTMSIKKTCIMSLKQLKEGAARKIIKDQEVDTSDIDIISRNQKIDIVEFAAYLGCFVCRNHFPEKEIETRITKASVAFNMLRNVIWYRKTVAVEAKLSIFRSCIIPVLLYGSEVWSITLAREKRLNTLYMACLRTIIGVNLGDRMSNEKLLTFTGQPRLENIMRRNRLR
ncbi:unnamed protein product [Didymodactylos carnosus]|uniref:Reverse transcriptase domain-containing protein n=1 Tax=Didymodactylos carnosus TaxID=1234261 RepID=A0A815TPB0_9BILA|nr:unnamed protein product [Didymodactylos carnosus]CAF1509257.1 unnamed protein product [Didymodactylos carnosus]CAF4156818.1 unnamed protein product [Didymodactylos carnosus]CAF4370158.1 unnamed protein product [Didymodactylos carnosus]